MFQEAPFRVFVIKSRSEEADVTLFRQLYSAMPVRKGECEPRMNIVAWRDGCDYVTVVFPRGKHRPSCYFASEDERMVISPGALDMAGLVISPREEDFNRMTADKLASILTEVSITEHDMENIKDRLKATIKPQRLSDEYPEPCVTVGIVNGKKIDFSLNQPYEEDGTIVSGRQCVCYENGAIVWNGRRYKELVFKPQNADASFSLEDVTIGVNFHWQRKETQTFLGILRFVVDGTAIWAINELPVERYLESVISSEMSATSSLRLLEAHAVISRSWLLAQIENRHSAKKEQTNLYSCITGKDKMIKWYDRQDHTLFDVCADDHCQRYQGITKETSPHVAEAIGHTRGQVLMSEGKICDARFSKCCGGAMEEFQYCWEDSPKPYLKAIGAGEKAAMFAGICTDKMKFLLYVIAGAITGFAAFINVIKVGSVTSSAGNQLETQILIALVLGGMPISGGAKVRFENIVVGSLLYIVLNSGLTMLGFSTQLMQLIQGLVFLVFVAVFADRKSLKVIK